MTAPYGWQESTLTVPGDKRIKLTAKQIKQYAHQLDVSGMSAAAQGRLLSGSTVILGASGSGPYVVKNLAQLGMGKILVIDNSLQALSSLQKILINDRIKASRAAGTLSNLDTKCSFKTESFAEGNIEGLVAKYDVVIDSLANWQHKLLLSDICMSLDKPMIHSGISGFRYQVFSMLPGRSACLRCALPLAGIDDVPFGTPKSGEIGAILAMVGAWQSLEAMKIIAHVGATQGNELFKFDCLSGEFDIIRGLDPQSDCPDCGKKLRRRRVR